MITTTLPIILASESPTRKKMLTDIGLPFEAIASSFDEEAAKAQLSTLPIPEQAQQLAQSKAQAVSKHYPEHLILAADLIGELAGSPLFKPHTAENNIKLLEILQGNTHWQHAAACLYLNNQLLASFNASTKLTMRSLTHADIATYVQTEKAWNCGGGYRYEGFGKHLFKSIEGDSDNILGLPLLPILNYLYAKQYLTFS